jgi:hypothetical protein
MDKRRPIVAQGPAKTQSCTFNLGPTSRDASGTYTCTFPAPIPNCVSYELAGFETQVVEHNVSSEQSSVVWTEGLRISTGEAPTFYDDVPVWDHELCIRETTADGNDHYYKVGLCPRFSEVSTQLWNEDTTARVASSVGTDLTAGSNATDFFFSTTRNRASTNGWAAPHYCKAFQDCRAAGSLADMELYTACMAQRRHVDLSDATTFTFREPTADPSPVYGGTQFQITSVAAAQAAFIGAVPTTITTESIAQGFLACSPWHAPDIVAMLNYQLALVTDSTASANALSNYNRCGTTSLRPSNAYKVEFSEGRFHLICTSQAVDFVVRHNTAGSGGVAAYRDVFHGDGSAYGGAAQTLARASLSTAPTGSSPRVTSLWTALGFRALTPKTFSRASIGGGTTESVRVYEQFGMRAPHAPSWCFQSTVDPAFYSAGTLASSLSSALNCGRPKPASAADPNTPASVLTFVDGRGERHSLLLTAGARTPFQMAASLEFMMNRLCGRGVFNSGHGYSYNDTHAQLANGRVGTGPTVDNERVFYRCSYDSDTQKFTFSARELTACSIANTAAISPAVAGAAIVQDPAVAVLVRFTLSFRSTDVGVSSATVGASSLNTSTAAALLGFAPETIWTGSTIVSTQPAACAPSHVQTLTRGLPNDLDDTASVCPAPLGDAVDGNMLARQNSLEYGGAGPDAHCYPSLRLLVRGSAVNDKRLSIDAALPATPFSTKNAAQKSGAGSTDAADGDTYFNNTTVLNLTAVDNHVTAVTPSGSKDMQAPCLVVMGKAPVTDGTTPSEALLMVTAVNSSTGAIATAHIAFTGSGTTTNAYSTAADYVGYQVNAGDALRIVAGTPATNAFTDDAETLRLSRVWVQAAGVRESLSAAGSGSWRIMQQTLAVAPGDLVRLGGHQSVLLGATNLGATDGHHLTITQVSDAGQIIAATATKPGGLGVLVGQHYVVMEGTCRTILRVTAIDGDTLGYSFALTQRGAGHAIVSGKEVRLFGPIVPYMTALVEEIGQCHWRRTTAAVTDPEGAFAAQFARPFLNASTSIYESCVTSLARDGSCAKLRIPYLAQYAYTSPTDRHSHPSNLMTCLSMDPPRIQFWNGAPTPTTDFGRTDTLWPAVGLVADSDVGRTLKLPNEWSLDSVAGILITVEDLNTDMNNVYVGRHGTIRNVLAIVTFGARVASRYANVHSKPCKHRTLNQLRLRLLDMNGDPYDLRNGSFRLTINVHSR